ncbi:craniofacial development protein 2-like [Centruroides vittatus]|uniref:craniofacial development protein 2-like n=1 Tax=Centruroides vittatus TaxID=120091 RepID=UPI003510C899
MLKVGKLKQLNQMLRKENILILAIQETRFIDINTTDSDNYRYFKGKPGKRIMRNTPHLGTAFCVHRTIVNSITKFQSPSGRLSLLTIKCANKSYTLINCHAPINEDNRKNPTKVEQFWEQLEDEISKIPRENVKILMGDFNAQIGKEKSVWNIVGKYPAHKRTNQNGLRLIELCKAFNLKLMSTNFKKLPRKQKTWRSPNPELGEFQIDHVAIFKQNQKEILNVKVKKGINFETNHYLTKIKTKLIPRRKIPRKTQKIKTIDRTKLQEESSRFRQMTKDIVNICSQFSLSNITSATEKLAPLKRSRKHRWWNAECDEALDNRIHTWRKWYSNKTQENYNTVKETRKSTAKILRNAKRMYNRKQLELIEESFQKNNTTDFYKTFKKNYKYQSPVCVLKRRMGN